MKNNVIKSQDGKITLCYNEVHCVCICSVIYALLQYMLIEDDENVIKHTAYFFGDGIKTDISKNLPSFHFATKQADSKVQHILRCIKKISLRINHNWKYPFVKKSKIYAQDHEYMSIIIGKKSYALLSDGPKCMEYATKEKSALMILKKRKQSSLRGTLEKWIYGPLTTDFLGNNAQCDTVYLTEENDVPYFKSKNVYIRSLKELWSTASDNKKQFIKNVFNISSEDIRLLGSKPILYLTQPLVDDKIITEPEYVELLQKIFSHYNTDDVIIKLHPRDTFPYSKYFPTMECFSKPINIQLLSLMDLNFEKAITISSSAINDLPDSIIVDWYGTSVHEKIKEFLGDTIVPTRAVQKVKL